MGGPDIVIAAQDLEKGQPPEKHDQHQDKTQHILPSKYQDGVVGLKLPHRPWLQCLSQFMDPNAQGFAIDLTERMKHFDIEVIHFTKSGKPNSTTKCSKPKDFELAMSEDEERTGTLVISEGLSRLTIETLGTKFELEPEFFASHLAGTELFRMGRYESPILRPPARTPNLLPSFIRKAPFYTAEYRRPYHLEGGHETVFRLRAVATNTPRGTQVIHPGLADVFIGEKISVYKKRGSNIGKSRLTGSAPYSYYEKPNVPLILQESFLLINSFPMFHLQRTCRIQSHRSTMMVGTSAPMLAGTKYQPDESSSRGSNV